jgi:hypothetical protein
MTSKTLARVLLAITTGLFCTDARARDPGDINTTGRRATSPPPSQPPQQQRFVPERMNPKDLHGRPQPQPAERRRLYEKVEDDIDRGNGRIEDQQTYELRRLRGDRDERLGRVQPQREAERVGEDVDRQERLDARAQRARDGQREAESPTKQQGPDTIVEPIPDRPTSVLARAVAEDERRLTSAREQYQADLRAAEVERDREATSGGTRQAKAQADRRFVERRGELTRDYQAVRRKILGTK